MYLPLTTLFLLLTFLTPIITPAPTTGQEYKNAFSKEHDHLVHGRCFCGADFTYKLLGNGEPRTRASTQMHITWMNYTSARKHKSYLHTFKCGPVEYHQDCWRKATEQNTGDHNFCHTFEEDGVKICMRKDDYEFDGHFMKRLPGWKYGREVKSKNKKKTRILDCTERCRAEFPDVRGVESVCNYTAPGFNMLEAAYDHGKDWKRKCGIKEYKALSVL